MDAFTRADLQALLNPEKGPFVSIYTPTRPGDLSNNRLAWSDQLREAQQQLLQQGAAAESVAALTAPAQAYMERQHEAFWKQTSSSLVTFLAPGLLRMYRLPLSLAGEVVVGPHFYVKPLLSYVTDDGRFFVLAISQNHVRLLECTANTVRHVEVPGLPKNMAQARLAHDRDDTLNFHTHPAGVGSAMEAVFHGMGVGIDDHKDELLHYFQTLDRELRPALGTDKTPLVLATVEYLAPIYRRANHFDRLLDKIVKGNPDKISDKDLRDKAWQIVAPLYRARTERAVQRFAQFNGTGRATNRLDEVLPAARRGELETLLVVRDRDAWGRYDAATDRVEMMATRAPGSEELSNLAVTYALGHGRNVCVVEPSESFGSSPAAGLYFMPMDKHGKK